MISMYDRMASTPEGRAELIAAGVRLHMDRLRAEVERLRDELADIVETHAGGGGEAIAFVRGQVRAYERVLDLIDKQREGQ